MDINYHTRNFERSSITLGWIPGYRSMPEPHTQLDINCFSEFWSIQISLTNCSAIRSNKIYTNCKSRLSPLHHCDVGKSARLRDSVARGIKLHCHNWRGRHQIHTSDDSIMLWARVSKLICRRHKTYCGCAIKT